ncbi:MAG: hypothetical protein IPM52_06325 [Bacteroidetes bacterium]|nr:hypothetical protein [Bacteroidota bacterium]
MRYGLFLSLVAAFAFMLFPGFGCGTRSLSTEEFLIRVDSIAHPDTVEAAKLFDVRFYGVIGPDGCHRFLRFETELRGDELKVWTVGERSIGEQLMCPANIPELGGQVLQVMAPDTGMLHLAVINPGLGNVLRSSVVVKTKAQ